MGLVAELDLDSGSFESKLKRSVTTAKAQGGKIGDAFEKAAKSGGKAMLAMGENVAWAVGKFVTFGAVVGTAAASIAIKLTANAIDAAESLDKMSQRTGFAVERLSTMKFAAQQSGSSLEGLETGLRRFNKTISEAAVGTGESGKQLTQLIGSIKQADGSLLSNEEILARVADRFSQFEDGAVKAAIAQDLFGRSGTELIPLLNQGSAGIAALEGQARKLGIEISTKTAKSAAEYTDNLNAIKQAWNALANQSAELVLPVLAKITGAMREGSEAGGLLEAAIRGSAAAWDEWTQFATGSATAADRTLALIQDQEAEVARLQAQLQEGAHPDDPLKVLAPWEEEALKAKLDSARALLADFQAQLQADMAAASVNDGFGAPMGDFSNEGVTGGVAGLTGEAGKPSSPIAALVPNESELEAARKRAEDHMKQLEEQTAFFYDEADRSRKDDLKKQQDIDKKKLEGQRTIFNSIGALAGAFGAKGHAFNVAMAVANATLSIAEAKAKALAQGGPLAGPPLIAAVTAAAVPIIAAIKSSKAPPAFAVGGIQGSDGPAWVGERGPELVNLPAGARVENASSSASRLSPTLNINIAASTEEGGRAAARGFLSEFRDNASELARAFRLSEFPDLATSIVGAA